jgi:hypothetical protein
VQAEIKIAKKEVGTKKMVIIQVETVETIMEKLDVYKVTKCFQFIFCHFIRILKMESKI